jgi:hypothetical protein
MNFATLLHFFKSFFHNTSVYATQELNYKIGSAVIYVVGGQPP